MNAAHYTHSDIQQMPSLLLPILPPPNPAAPGTHPHLLSLLSLPAPQLISQEIPSAPPSHQTQNPTASPSPSSTAPADAPPPLAQTPRGLPASALTLHTQPQGLHSPTASPFISHHVARKALPCSKALHDHTLQLDSTIPEERILGLDKSTLS